MKNSNFLTIPKNVEITDGFSMFYREAKIRKRGFEYEMISIFDDSDLNLEANSEKIWIANKDIAIRISVRKILTVRDKENKQLFFVELLNSSYNLKTKQIVSKIKNISSFNCNVVEKFDKVKFTINCRDKIILSSIAKIKYMSLDKNINIRSNNFKKGLVKIEINYTKKTESDIILEQIKSIIAFFTFILSVQCFEEEIFLNKGDEKHLLIMTSTNNIPSSKMFVYERVPNEILTSDLFKNWINVIYPKYKTSILFLVYMHRNDFNNPQMYLKEMISYFEGFYEMHFGKYKANSIQREFLEDFKVMISDDKYNFDKETTENLANKRNMFFDKRFEIKIGTLLREFKEINFSSLFKLKLKNTRNKLMHDPQFCLKLEEERNTSKKEDNIFDRFEVVFVTILLRECLIYIILKEVIKNDKVNLWLFENYIQENELYSFICDPKRLSEDYFENETIENT